MKKNRVKKLVLHSETLRVLGTPGAGYDVMGGVRGETGPDDETCYWGCSFETCPAGGCQEL